MTEITQPSTQQWHALPSEELVATLRSSAAEGLDAAEVTRRLSVDGPNVLAADSGPTLGALVLAQVRNPMV